MAVTLAEQRMAFEDGPLRNKVAQAMCVAANVPLTGEATGFANHVNRVILARQILSGQHVDAFMRSAIAANGAVASLAVLLAASDAAIQANINAVFDNFANGG